MSQNERLVDNRQIAHAAIANFLQQQGYQSTLESFQKDAEKAGWSWPKVEEHKNGLSSSQQISLESLIELHQSNLALEAQHRRLAKKLLSKSPTELTLPGPAMLNFKVTRTYANLHNSNILSLTLVDLPTYSFSITEARYVTSNKQLLCSTAADKRVVFSDVEDGEMVEIFEPGTGAMAEDQHSAAVLWTAQNPNKNRKREFASCGMDGKIIIWDLLHRKPIQVLRNHTKFVVKCAFSPSGDYLASCSYDKTISIYKRHGSESTQARGDDNEDEDDEIPPLLDTRYELIHTAVTVNNPESILFVQARPRPSKSDLGLAKEELVLGTDAGLQAQDEDDDDEAPSKRTWLAFTVRSDCFIHYIALPMSADQDHTTSVDQVSASLDHTHIKDTEASTADWSQLHFNTNQNRGDFHVSYSLMHLTLHPTGQHICIQTGDHSIPSTGYASSSSSSSLSRILILPLLSSLRSTTLWTGVESNGFATIRHDWLPDGSAAWVTSEEGFVRLVDTQGKIRAKVLAHGVVAAEADEMSRAATWTRGGNSLIKSLVVLNEHIVFTCGYDRTIRCISPF